MTKYTDEGCIECGRMDIYAKHLCNKCYQRRWNKKRLGRCNMCGVPNRRLYANGKCESCVRKKQNYIRKKTKPLLSYRRQAFCPVCGISPPSACKHKTESKYKYCDICGKKFDKPGPEANHYRCWRDWCLKGRGIA